MLSVIALEVYVREAKYHSSALFPLGAISVHTEPILTVVSNTHK
jgi:hypothetical protein